MAFSACYSRSTCYFESWSAGRAESPYIIFTSQARSTHIIPPSNMAGSPWPFVFRDHSQDCDSLRLSKESNNDEVIQLIRSARLTIWKARVSTCGRMLTPNLRRRSLSFLMKSSLERVFGTIARKNDHTRNGQALISALEIRSEMTWLSQYRYSIS